METIDINLMILAIGSLFIIATTIWFGVTFIKQSVRRSQKPVAVRIKADGKRR